MSAFWTILTTVACTPSPRLETYDGPTFSIDYPQGSRVQPSDHAVVFDGTTATHRFSQGLHATFLTAQAPAYGKATTGRDSGGGSGGTVYTLRTRESGWELTVEKHCPEFSCGSESSVYRELERLTRAMAATYHPTR